MTAKKPKLICLCNGVSDREILSALKRGARDLEESVKSPDLQQRLNSKNSTSG